MSNQRRGIGYGVMLLIYELVDFGFEYIPPVTLFVIMGQIIIFTEGFGVFWDKWDVCINAESVIYRREFSRMFLSAFEHGDDMHLYYNMISFLYKGRVLEIGMFGASSNFAFFLAWATFMCSTLYVILSVFFYWMFKRYMYMKNCAIGFSSVIFMLKTFTAKRHAETNGDGTGTHFNGLLKIPYQYTVWAELILIHLLVPGASFVGHLAGILAGLIYMHTPLGTVIDRTLLILTGKHVYRWAFLRGYPV